jgi:hypothetical protein
VRDGRVVDVDCCGVGERRVVVKVFWGHRAGGDGTPFVGIAEVGFTTGSLEAWRTENGGRVGEG